MSMPRRDYVEQQDLGQFAELHKLNAVQLVRGTKNGLRPS